MLVLSAFDIAGIVEKVPENAEIAGIVEDLPELPGLSKIFIFWLILIRWKYWTIADGYYIRSRQ